MTMGVHENPEEAAKTALNKMLDFLVVEKRLSRENTYVLASALLTVPRNAEPGCSICSKLPGPRPETT
jgi:hypothetical protein